MPRKATRPSPISITTYLKGGQLVVKGVVHPDPSVYIGKEHPVLLTFESGKTVIMTDTNTIQPKHQSPEQLETLNELEKVLARTNGPKQIGGVLVTTPGPQVTGMPNF